MKKVKETKHSKKVPGIQHVRWKTSFIDLMCNAGTVDIGTSADSCKYKQKHIFQIFNQCDTDFTSLFQIFLKSFEVL